MPMPIVRLLEGAAFDPETTRILGAAFDAAWHTIQTSGSTFASNDQIVSTREFLAKRIIEMGQRGERDPHKLAEDAVAHLAHGRVGEPG